MGRGAPSQVRGGEGTRPRGGNGTVPIPPLWTAANILLEASVKSILNSSSFPNVFSFFFPLFFHSASKCTVNDAMKRGWLEVTNDLRCIPVTGRAMGLEASLSWPGDSKGRSTGAWRPEPLVQAWAPRGGYGLPRLLPADLPWPALQACW